MTQMKQMKFEALQRERNLSLYKEKEMEKKGEKCSGMRVAPTEAKLLGGEGAHGTTVS
jgi:hypothetical protein